VSTTASHRACPASRATSALWRPAAGAWAVDAARAGAAGLVCRPVRDMVVDTWRWLRVERPVRHERQAAHGLDPDREAALLAAWETEWALRRR
jgi:2'-hydroxyisoflavone reductase